MGLESLYIRLALLNFSTQVFICNQVSLYLTLSSYLLLHTNRITNNRYQMIRVVRFGINCPPVTHSRMIVTSKMVFNPLVYNVSCIFYVRGLILLSNEAPSRYTLKFQEMLSYAIKSRRLTNKTSKKHKATLHIPVTSIRFIKTNIGVTLT